MAQKRRGLGRGLQALIPEAQKEKVSASRPSDVFFPDSRKAEVQDEKAPSEPEHAAPEPEPEAEARSTRDLTATLLAPSQRKRGSKSRSTRSTSSKTTEKSKQTTSVHVKPRRIRLPRRIPPLLLRRRPERPRQLPRPSAPDRRFRGRQRHRSVRRRRFRRLWSRLRKQWRS